MLDDFHTRRFHVTGQVLHLFGQMLWLSKIGSLNWSLSETATECKKYVDDLRANGTIEPLTGEMREDFHFGAFAGLGFSQSDTAEFKELYQYVRAQRTASTVEGYPAEAQALLELMTSAPAKFIEEIAYRADGAAAFARIPVLAAIAPKAFADALIKLPALAYREVIVGFSARYDGARLDYELANEKQWAEELESELMRIGESGDPVFRDRICETVKWTLTKELDRFRADAQQRSGADHD